MQSTALHGNAGYRSAAQGKASHCKAAQSIAAQSSETILPLTRKDAET